MWKGFRKEKDTIKIISGMDVISAQYPLYGLIIKIEQTCASTPQNH